MRSWLDCPSAKRTMEPSRSQLMLQLAVGRKAAEVLGVRRAMHSADNEAANARGQTRRASRIAGKTPHRRLHHEAVPMSQSFYPPASSYPTLGSLPPIKEAIHVPDLHQRNGTLHQLNRAGNDHRARRNSRTIDIGPESRGSQQGDGSRLLWAKSPSTGTLPRASDISAPAATFNGDADLAVQIDPNCRYAQGVSRHGGGYRAANR